MIANNGSSDIFYDPNGPIVQSLVSTIQNWGGIITPQDFASYKVNLESPLVSTIDNYTFTLPMGYHLGWHYYQD